MGKYQTCHWLALMPAMCEVIRKFLACTKNIGTTFCLALLTSNLVKNVHQYRNTNNFQFDRWLIPIWWQNKRYTYLIDRCKGIMANSRLIDEHATSFLGHVAANVDLCTGSANPLLSDSLFSIILETLHALVVYAIRRELHYNCICAAY